MGNNNEAVKQMSKKYSVPQKVIRYLIEEGVLTATALAREIRSIYGVAITPAVMARIRQLQKKARSARDYQSKKKAK